METVRLEDGELAAIDTDCIVVQRRHNGRFKMTGSALSGEDSVSFGGASYDSFQDAVASGIAWAEGHGVAKLYISSVGPNDDLSPV